MRVAVIGSIWQARCHRHEGDPSETLARRAARQAVATVVSAIQRDWARVNGDVHSLDSGAFCQDWWRGMDAVMREEDFKEMWVTDPPVLCAVHQGALAIKLGMGHPVQLPA
jgi:hypothetical protein